MPLTQAQARDEILGRLKTTVESSGIVPLPTIVWDDQATTISRATNTRWIRAKLQHIISPQATLGDDLGRRHYTNGGILTVEIRTPFDRGSELWDQIATTIRDAYRGYSTPGGVWFRNARISEIGNDGAWFQVNVYVDFEYDEYK